MEGVESSFDLLNLKASWLNVFGSGVDLAAFGNVTDEFYSVGVISLQSTGVGSPTATWGATRFATVAMQTVGVYPATRVARRCGGNTMSDALAAPFPGLYQVAYVTNDFERALKQFTVTHRIGDYFRMPEIHYPTGPQREAVCNIALAYVGAIEIEIIDPLAGDVQLYRDYLPSDGAFAVRFHHLSRLFDSREALEQQIAAYRREGRAIPVDGDSSGSRYFYADFRTELGHYMEGIYFAPETKGWLASIPRF